MIFVPTLNFNGKCREAMELYQKAFDGKVMNFNPSQEEINFVNDALRKFNDKNCR